MNIKTMILLLGSVYSLSAAAEEMRPPPEAIESCKNQSSGASCSFKGKQGETVSGTCWSPESSKPLACKPAQDKHQKQKGPQNSDVP